MATQQELQAAALRDPSLWQQAKDWASGMLEPGLPKQSKEFDCKKQYELAIRSGTPEDLARAQYEQCLLQ